MFVFQEMFPLRARGLRGVGRDVKGGERRRGRRGREEGEKRERRGGRRGREEGGEEGEKRGEKRERRGGEEGREEGGEEERNASSAFSH